MIKHELFRAEMTSIGSDRLVFLKCQSQAKVLTHSYVL